MTAAVIGREIIHAVTRRELIGAGLATGLLAACGENRREPQAAEPAPAAAPTVRRSAGETVITGKSSRVIALDGGEDLEQIASLRPDLIVASALNIYGDLDPKLTVIAPPLVADRPTAPRRCSARSPRHRECRSGPPAGSAGSPTGEVVDDLTRQRFIGAAWPAGCWPAAVRPARRPGPAPCGRALPPVQAGRVVRLDKLDAFSNPGPIGFEVIIDRLTAAVERLPAARPRA